MHAYIHTSIHTRARTHTHAHTHTHIRMWMQAPFRIPQIKCLIKQLLAGTEFMHRHWVIHRDMKTSNLLLDNGGNLKICDFGLARKYRDPIAPMTPEVWLARVVCVSFCFTAIRSRPRLPGAVYPAVCVVRTCSLDSGVMYHLSLIHI